MLVHQYDDKLYNARSQKALCICHSLCLFQPIRKSCYKPLLVTNFLRKCHFKPSVSFAMNVFIPLASFQGIWSLVLSEVKRYPVFKSISICYFPSSLWFVLYVRNTTQRTVVMEFKGIPLHLMLLRLRHLFHFKA